MSPVEFQTNMQLIDSYLRTWLIIGIVVYMVVPIINSVFRAFVFTGLIIAQSVLDFFTRLVRGKKDDSDSGVHKK